jgi:predicted nucleotidyltransferase
MDCEAIERRLRDFFAARAEGERIAAAYLFGSVARGTAGPESDVDVGVLYSGEPPKGLDAFRLAGEIEDLLGVPVQVVTLDAAPPDLAHRVLLGKLLVNRDPSRRVRFEVKAHNEFFDIEPDLHLYRRTTGRRE